MRTGERILRMCEWRDALAIIFCYVVSTKIIFTKHMSSAYDFCHVIPAIQFSSRSAVGKNARCDFLGILHLFSVGNLNVGCGGRR